FEIRRRTSGLLCFFGNEMGETRSEYPKPRLPNTGSRGTHPVLRDGKSETRPESGKTHGKVKTRTLRNPGCGNQLPSPANRCASLASESQGGDTFYLERVIAP